MVFLTKLVHPRGGPSLILDGEDGQAALPKAQGRNSHATAPVPVLEPAPAPAPAPAPTPTRTKFQREADVRARDTIGDPNLVVLVYPNEHTKIAFTSPTDSTAAAHGKYVPMGNRALARD